VLKGGTALNLFLGPPKRLSVDLDFNYVGQLDRQEAAKARPAVEENLERIARAQGHAVQLRQCHVPRGRPTLRWCNSAVVICSP
jgi:predicted nucleotidyltransferase component of viral defense system